MCVWKRMNDLQVLLHTAGHSMVLVWEGSSCGESGLFHNQSMCILDTKVPSKSFWEVFPRKRRDLCQECRR